MNKTKGLNIVAGDMGGGGAGGAEDDPCWAAAVGKILNVPRSPHVTGLVPREVPMGDGETLKR